MAAGKPVISSWVGGLSDLIIDQYNGLLVDIYPDALERAIEALIQDPEKRKQLGAKALETVQTFTLQQWKKRWMDALLTVWGERP
jgi:glycosyltransferase involved in cell wall biosynthesis